MAAKFTIQLVGDASSASKALGDVGKAGDNLDGKTSGWSSRWSSAFGNMGGILARFSSDGSSNAGGLLGSLNGLNDGGTAALGALGGAAGMAASGVATALQDMATKAFDVTKQIGEDLYNLGDQYNNAYNTIRRGTGDTGAALGDLKGSFKDVYESTAASSNDVAGAMTLLNQRLDVTGQPLEDLTLQFLRMSTVAGGDVTSNIQSVTGALQNWGVPAQDMIGVSDALFRTFQESGVPIGTLADQLSTSGSTLRNFGFDVEHAAGFLGFLGKNGLDASAVLPGLNRLFAESADKGISARDAFAGLQESVKSAASNEDAKEILEPWVGAKGAGRMADLLRTGKFEFEGFADSIAGGGDTIANAASDTATWRGSWAKFTHYLENTVEPVATTVFGVINDGLSGGITMAKGWVDAFKEGGIDGLFDQMGTDFDTVKANFKTLLANAKKWWEEHGDEVIDGLKEGFKKGMEKLGEGASWLLDKLGEWLPKIGDWIMNTGVPWLEDHWGEWWKTATDWFGKMAPVVIEKLGGLLADLTGWFVGTALPWAFKTGWDWMSSLFKWILTDGIPTLIGALGGLLGAVWEWIETDGVSAMADAGRNLWGALGEGVVGVFNWIIEKWNALDFAVDIKLPDALGGGTLWKDDDIIPDIPLIDTRSASEKSTGGGVVRAMASGGEFTARRPTLMMVGDLGQHERVSVRPAGSDGGSIENAGRPLQVNLQVDGKTVATQVYPHIVVMERSRGVRR